MFLTESPNMRGVSIGLEYMLVVKALYSFLKRMGNEY